MIQEGKPQARSDKDFPFIIFKFSFVIEDDFVIDEGVRLQWKMRNEKWKMENLEHSFSSVSLCLCG
jgi:hypothetical protein